MEEVFTWGYLTNEHCSINKLFELIAKGLINNKNTYFEELIDQIGKVILGFHVDDIKTSAGWTLILNVSTIMKNIGSKEAKINKIYEKICKPYLKQSQNTKKILVVNRIVDEFVIRSLKFQEENILCIANLLEVDYW